MSLFCQTEDCSSLSPASSWPAVVPRRTSARSRNATLDAEVLVMVTVVAWSAPPGPDRVVGDAVATMDEGGSPRSDRGFAYWLSTAGGWPRVFGQFPASRRVDSQ